MSGIIYRHGDTQKMDWTPAAVHDAGDVIELGTGAARRLGITSRNFSQDELDAGRLSALNIDGGMYDVPKSTEAATGFSAGDAVFWNTTDDQAEKTSATGTHARLGFAEFDAADADEYVRVYHQSNTVDA